MFDELHLPWDRSNLEALAIKALSLGEATKVDLKSIFDLTTKPQQAEFLKDVSAIANSYDPSYLNHGFIIFGAGGARLIYTTFPDTEDHLQATIDNVVKSYIGPFIKTHFFIFGDSGARWGVLVVPPTRSAPHVFYNDIDNRHKGDIYVRTGTTTDKAQPGDYSRFFRQHIEESSYELKQGIKDLELKFNELNVNFKNLKKPSIGAKKKEKKITETEEPATRESQTLNELIESVLAKEVDPVTSALLAEARKINTFMDGSAIPWDLRDASKEQSDEVVNQIESQAKEFWAALGHILLNDDEGKYDDAVLSAIAILARYIEPTAPHTDWGSNIRYLPLFIALYIICIAGVARKRDALLKKVLKIRLSRRSVYEESLPITYILFMIRRADAVLQPLHHEFPNQRWCDPFSAYAQSVIGRILNPININWDKEKEFFIGEFVLCLAPVDDSVGFTDYPSAGAYIYFSVATPIIKRFLKSEAGWLKKVYSNKLEDLLRQFDQKVKDLGKSNGCWPDGFQGGALEAAFPEKEVQQPSV